MKINKEEKNIILWSITISMLGTIWVSYCFLFLNCGIFTNLIVLPIVLVSSSYLLNKIGDLNLF